MLFVELFDKKQDIEYGKYVMDMQEKIVPIMYKLGFNDKEARVYLAVLELGEATVRHIAKHSCVKRTSLYYVLEKMKKEGILLSSKKRRKKLLYGNFTEGAYEEDSIECF